MTLSELRAAAAELARDFDPALVATPEAEGMLEDAAAIERIGATLKVLLAARVADAGVWNRRGDPSAARDLARRTGTSVGRAQAAITTGRRLRHLAATADAARRGGLSVEQAALIADAATDDPGAEDRLLDAARAGSLGELRNECARTKANVCDLEERRRRIHDQRHLRTWTAPDGVGHLHLRDNPENVATIMAKVVAERDGLATDARSEGRHAPLEALAADALQRIVCGAPSVGSPQKTSRGGTKLLVRVDLDALLRGYPVADETCDIAGFGPVAVSAIRDMIDTQDPLVAAIATRGKKLVGVAHLGRRPNAIQQTALDWLYPTCGALGCNSVTFLQTDHRADWSQTHVTVFDLLDRLCRYHHWLKTTQGWSLVDGHGKRAFVPPDDPRHPRHSKRQTAA